MPSRVNPYASVPNRYFGARCDGELKIRGSEARRGDTPEFIDYTTKIPVALREKQVYDLPG